jgi:AraC family transcriptional regulator
LILRDMPAIWDASFRPWFYSRWGRENCIIAARTERAEYPVYQQRLSIKAAWGGRESYYIDGRQVAVDDETYLILNDARSYSSRLRNRTPVTSFSVFFRPGMAEDIVRTVGESQESLLDEPSAQTGRTLEFSEHARRHDRQITPVLRFIYLHVTAGITNEAWYEEQLYFLLGRMIALRGRDRRVTHLIPATRPGTRTELFRRVALGVDFINVHFADPIGLREIAAAALLSPYHCLRVFKAVHGVTPHAFLNERRLQVAERLLRDSRYSLDEVALRVGFQSRTTLFRQMKRSRGVAPTAMRLSQQQPSWLPTAGEVRE